MANEKRLIDANARIEEIKKAHCTNCESYNGIRCRACWVDDAIGMIDDAPTVDAVEVVHGRWIFKNNPITDPKGYFIRIVCSNCNLHTGQKSNFCPQCGADMRGEEDGK